MQAIIQTAYGPLEDVFRLEETDKPVAGDGEVLVRVHASPVSGSDWHIYRGLPYAARPVTGLRRPRNRTPGMELAGTVEAIGRDVQLLRPGDEVFGWYGGSFAEYAVVPEGQLLPRPANLTLDEAAAVPIASFTALQAVRDRGGVQAGQRVLITGASGGVGLYAVQIAKSYGAEVTAVCSGAKADLVRRLGADHVVDYARESFADRNERYDVLIDLYGNPSLSACRRALKAGGTLVLAGGTGGRWFMGVDRWFRGVLAGPFLRIRVRPLIHKDRLDDLATMVRLIEDGRVTPVLDRTFPLAGVTGAIEYVRSGHARGQVVIAVAGSRPGDAG